MPKMPTRLLILGGTTEATQLAHAVSNDPRFVPTLSYAGRTRAPAPPPIPHRVGGFGGEAGLISWLDQNRIELMIDATHPFARRMSRHASNAARALHLPFLAILRPAWSAVPGDRWTVVDSMEQAAVRLGTVPRRVFLTIGQQELAPFAGTPHHCVVRSIDPPAALPPNADLILARGPFDEANERALLAIHRIDVLVTKNSGGAATSAKLAAARALGIEVVMVARPPEPDGPTAPDAAAALAWLSHQAALRGA